MNPLANANIRRPRTIDFISVPFRGLCPYYTIGQGACQEVFSRKKSHFLLDIRGRGGYNLRRFPTNPTPVHLLYHPWAGLSSSFSAKTSDHWWGWVPLSRHPGVLWRRGGSSKGGGSFREGTPLRGVFSGRRRREGVPSFGTPGSATWVAGSSGGVMRFPLTTGRLKTTPRGTPS